MRLVRWSSLFACLLLLGVACQGPALGVDDGATPRLSGNEAEDRATLRRLADEARTLARTDGCVSAGQCAAAPMGAKPCGGPWTYLPYCPRTTDRVALQAKLDELHRFEQGFNAHYGIGSTCDFVGPPQLRIEGGQCTADVRGVPY